MANDTYTDAPPAVADILSGSNPQDAATVNALTNSPVSAPDMAAPQGVTPGVQSPNDAAAIQTAATPEAGATNPSQAQPRVWQRILQGALVGLAGSAGAKNFGSGLAGGAANVIEQKQVQVQNDQRQQQINSQTNDANARLALIHIQTADLSRQFDMAPKNMQDEIRQTGVRQGELYRQNGIDPAFSGRYTDALAFQHKAVGANAQSPLNTVITPNTDGGFDVFTIPDPNKLNATPAVVTVGYTKDKNGNDIPVTHTVPANTMKIVDIAAANTQALHTLVDQNSKQAAELQNEKAKQQLPLAQSQIAKNNAEAQKAQAEKPDKNAANMMTGSLPNGNQVAGTPEELKAAGATGITKLGVADQSKVSVARQLISPDGLLSNTEKDLAAFKPEELSAIGSRWNEFVTGKLGSGDPRYVALRTDSQLLSTALMQAHVGSRGSEGMMEHFKGLADAGKMSGETLKTALATERRYVTEKAMLPSGSRAATDPAAAYGGKSRP